MKGTKKRFLAWRSLAPFFDSLRVLALFLGPGRVPWYASRVWLKLERLVGFGTNVDHKHIHPMYRSVHSKETTV